MEQQKFFYNVCNDLWAFAKTLDKEKDSMTDEDWAAAISLRKRLQRSIRLLGRVSMTLLFHQ